jgi:hypothetical protein
VHTTQTKLYLLLLPPNATREVSRFAVCSLSNDPNSSVSSMHVIPRSVRLHWYRNAEPVYAVQMASQ